jgi:hypothetical protein
LNDGSAPTDATAVLAAPTSPDGGLTWNFGFASNSSFVDTSNGVSTGSLVDGIYTLRVDPAKVTANAVAMTTAPQPLTFHRLFGDINGDGAVNPLDYVGFRNTFGNELGNAGYVDPFDFNNDGAVNPLDYVQFRSRFGKAFTY